MPRHTRKRSSRRPSHTRKHRGGGVAPSKASRKIEPAARSRSRSPPRAPPSSPASPNKMQTYTFPFTANLIRRDEKMPSKKLQERARKRLEEAEWQEYIRAVMRDAVNEKYSSTKKEEVPFDDLEITLEPSTTEKEEPKDFFYATYTGKVSWTSVPCSLARVQKEVDWRIGDRMSMYEISHDNWQVYIHPGKVSVA